MKTDAVLKQDVQAELAWDPNVDETRIGVAVKDSVVTLSGHLDSLAEKVAAERAAKRVFGVKALAVEIEVTPLAAHRRSDTEIAAAARSALSWNSQVPDGRVSLKVEGGHVTLEGELDWGFQRRSAETVIRPLLGVTGISNRITIRPRALPGDLSARIQTALTRQAMREAKRVQLTVDPDGLVTLEGPVHSWAERNAVEGAVWSAPGVTGIINRISVET
ncbi:BON domain-containing protein [Roseateles oligotrophus]|uniref:BON domain-containing protein n=1 Tax=Roseateles oligotrophus TaxID=1769250 RepID=A0ABT2YMQ2_9BURK|nr:BON domain-containing protein [Roseateles oligotrophus]MCV2371336.1 BON domain-containing protein [Roseateles oligotrophus]